MALKRIVLLLIILVLVVPLAVTGCGGEDKQSSPDQVSIMLSFPDQLDTYNAMIQGAQLALEQAGGKAGDVEVEFIIQPTSDDETVYSLEKEQASAEAAVKDKSVVAYIGLMSSSQAKTGIPILNKADIASFSVSATWPGLTKPGFGAGEPGIHYPSGKRSFFRVVSSDDIQAVIASRWVAAQGYKTVYLVDNGTTYGTGLTGIFEVQATDLGLEILGHAQYERDSANAAEFEAIAEDVIAADPDIVYCGVHAYGGGADLIGTLRRADPEIRILSGDAMVPYTNIFEVIPPELVNGIFATDVDLSPPDMGYEATDAFIASYTEKYGTAPIGAAMSTYDITNLLLGVIAGTDRPTRQAVLEGVQEMPLYSGALGDWKFDANGDISNQGFGLWETGDGAWQFLQVIRND